MPSKSAKQARFMAMCAHTPGAAKGKCPPKSVAKEFNQADKARGKNNPLRDGYHKVG